MSTFWTCASCVTTPSESVTRNAFVTPFEDSFFLMILPSVRNFSISDGVSATAPGAPLAAGAPVAAEAPLATWAEHGHGVAATRRTAINRTRRAIVIRSPLSWLRNIRVPPGNDHGRRMRRGRSLYTRTRPAVSMTYLEGWGNGPGTEMVG